MSEWQTIEKIPLKDENGSPYWDEEPFQCDVIARRYNNRLRKFEYQRFANIQTFKDDKDAERRWSWPTANCFNDENSFYNNNFPWREWEILFWMAVPDFPENL